MPSASDTACAAGMDFETAQAILAAHALPLGIESVPLAEASGRTLAKPVMARIGAPRRDCAAMDGYAVRAADLDSGRPLRLAGTCYAGSAEAGRISPGEAIRVMTGAPMPDGADRIVVIERSMLLGDRVQLRSLPGDRDHVRHRDSDFAAGTILVSQGAILDPCALVAAAAGDVGTVQVWRRPRVRIVTTGDEIVAPGSAHGDLPAVPDSLSIALGAFARQWGASDVSTCRLADDPVAIRATACAALPDTDVIVIAGGASRGDRDHCRSALAALGLELAFADLAIRPGKPVWLGRLGRLAVLGLPGNPTAALTVARLFLAPLLTGLGGGLPDGALQWRNLPLGAAIGGNGDRESFLCAAPADMGVRLLDRQSASGQRLLARTRYLVRRPINAAPLDARCHVPVLAMER